MPFADLGLSPLLQAAAQQLGYHTPTPVQLQAVPAILQGGDVQVCAQTGSGKTAAYLLPLVQLLLRQPVTKPRRLRLLVVVPTRELANQVGKSLVAMTSQLVLTRQFAEPIKSVVAFGGVSINPQMLALRGGADVVVATPGRLLDLVDHNALTLADVQHLVLDEADRLLALGFGDELGRVMSLLPPQRQTILVSATFAPAVQRLANDLLRDPSQISIDPAEAADAGQIVQRVIEVDEGKRTQLLRHLLQTEAWSRVLVFVASRYAADHLASKLIKNGVSVTRLHGDLSQGARTAGLADFAAGKVQVLVATDVAARGLDIVQLPAVVNFDLPRSADDYLHRIGRTGRAGESGVAVSFVTASTDGHFRLIERRHGLTLLRERLPGFEPTELASPQSDPSGGIKGKRPSKKDKLRQAQAQAQGSQPPWSVGS